VWPATNVDGVFGAYSGNIPMGSLWVIPSGVDLNSLGLSSPEAIAYAKAIQQYGAYVVDSAPVGTNHLLLYANDLSRDKADLITGYTGSPAYSMPNLKKIADAMVMVKNNTPTHPGGYGKRVSETTGYGIFPM